MNYMEAAFAPAEARQKQAVMAETWGHLAPKKDRCYILKITWVLGCYASANLNPTVLESKTDLTDSPWFYDAMIDFLRSISRDSGSIFQFDGTFKNYRFNGNIFKLDMNTMKWNKVKQSPYDKYTEYKYAPSTKNWSRRKPR